MAIAEHELEQPLEHVIDPILQQELLQYPGKWVVITRSKLISVAESLVDAEAAAVDYPEAMLHYIPKDTGTVYFF